MNQSDALKRREHHQPPDMKTDKIGRPLTGQQIPRPRWAGWVDDPGFIGPNPYIMWPYLILKHLRFQRAGTKKPQHVYRVRCLVCGETHERVQGSIIRAVDSKAKGCINCLGWKLDGTASVKARRSTATTNARQEWLAVMRMWPVTNIRHIPESKRFDGRKI